MADPKKLAEEAMARALISAGEDAARRTASDLLGGEERTSAADAAAAKRKRTKIIILVVLCLLLLVGILGLMVAYWHYFLAAGVLGLLIYYLHWRWQRRRGAKEDGDLKEESARGRVETERDLHRDHRADSDSNPQDIRVSAEREAADIEAELDALRARLKE